MYNQVDTAIAALFQEGEVFYTERHLVPRVRMLLVALYRTQGSASNLDALVSHARFIAAGMGLAMYEHYRY
jgi:hypothetical protein